MTNRSPIARNDSYKLYYNLDGPPFYISLYDALSNDSDPDGDTLSIVSVTGSDGKSYLKAGNSEGINFDVSDWSGKRYFDYVITDGKGATASARIDVEYTVDSAGTSSKSVAEDGSLDVIKTTEDGYPRFLGGYRYDPVGALTNPKHGTLEYVAGFTEVEPVYKNLENGEVAIYYDGYFYPTTQVIYKPAPNFSGVDTFSIVVESSMVGGSQQGSYNPKNYHAYQFEVFVQPVNDEPTAVDDLIRVQAGASTSIPISRFLANDLDVDGDTLTFIGVNSAVNAMVSYANGLVTLTTDAGLTGNASFTYRISDGSGLTDVATVVVEVSPTNTTQYVPGTSAADQLDYTFAKLPVFVEGFGGNDTLRTGKGNDTLAGGAGNDILSGGAGDDILTGGTGADRMAGGTGNDTFIIAAGDLGMSNTTDQIVDFQGAGRAGGDLILFAGFGVNAALSVAGSLGNSTIYNVFGENGTLAGRILVASGGVALQTGDYVFT